MNIKELKKALDREGVQPVYYSLNGIQEVHEVGAAIGAAVLDKKGEKWMYYNYERGGKFDVTYFDTEDEACRYMFRQLTKHADTRVFGPDQAAKNDILLRVVRAHSSGEAQEFLDKQLKDGKITSDQASKHMELWRKVHLRQT